MLHPPCFPSGDSGPSSGPATYPSSDMVMSMITSGMGALPFGSCALSLTGLSLAAIHVSRAVPKMPAAELRGMGAVASGSTRRTARHRLFE